MGSHRSTKKPARFHESMRAIGNDHFQIILVELFPCTCKAELEAREYAIMSGFKKEELYNSVIDGKHDDATRQKMRQKMRDNNPSKGKFGADSAVFKRGSVSEFKSASGKSGFQFQWQMDGKKMAKSFTYGLVRTHQMAYQACVDLQNQIYPLPNLEEQPVVE